MGGIFSLQQYYRNSPSPPSTLGLVRRRTVFGENSNSSGSGWGVRGVVCPEELVDAVDSSVDGELPLGPFVAVSGHNIESDSHIGLSGPSLFSRTARSGSSGVALFCALAQTIRRVN